MRNLLEYPVTRQEILLFLGRVRDERDPALIGDMSPILCEHVIDIVKAAFDLADGFNRRMDEPGMGFVTPFPEATKLLEATTHEIAK